jgi:hypothetical protein
MIIATITIVVIVVVAGLLGVYGNSASSLLNVVL